jgi:hypothetical protein
MKAARLGWALLLVAIAPAGLGSPAVGSAQAAPRGSERESFEEFFTRFRQDSTFQLSRIRFPLPRFSQADDAEQRLARRDWQFEPFYSGQETYTQMFDNFAMGLADTDERVYALIGVESDIRQNYFFRRSAGRWYLVRVEDLSM